VAQEIKDKADAAAAAAKPKKSSTCVDAEDLCVWLKDDCKDDMMLSYMQKNCKKTCNMC